MTPISEVAITGANGFVGSRLCRDLSSHGRHVRACARVDEGIPPGAQFFSIEDVTDVERWVEVFDGVDCVVHLAALVHQPGELDLDLYRKINVEGTNAVATASIECGVRRLIFVSTIKVNGETSDYDRPFHADDPPAGLDPYAVSKREAEDCLRRLSARSGMEVVVIRPVLVYGPGVRGNFLRMLKLVQSGFPLPLGSVVNRRSILFVDNLCALIRFCCESDKVAGRVLLASDGAPVSTPRLLSGIAHELGKRPRLIRIPVSCLVAAARLLGKAPDVRRLCGSLHVDTQWMSELDWNPPVSTEDGLAATVDWFKQSRTDG